MHQTAVFMLCHQTRAMKTTSITEPSLIAPTNGSYHPRSLKRRLLHLYAVIKNWDVYLRTPNGQNKRLGPTNVRGAILKKNGKISPKAHLQLYYTKTAELFINIPEQFRPSLGIIQGGSKHHRNPNAPAFADRDPHSTLWAEDDERTAAWQMSKKNCTKFAHDVPEELSCILHIKVGMHNSINLNRQSRRQREVVVDSGHPCI